MKRESPRAELRYFMGSGRLRDAVAGKLSTEAADLLVIIVDRYCASRRKRPSPFVKETP